LAFAWYPLSMWIGVVYLGEHYALDVFIGAIYALAAYGATNWLFDRYAHRARAIHGRWRQRYQRRPAVAASTLD
jgi:membrane-associated phospholipid phosphatase